MLSGSCMGLGTLFAVGLKGHHLEKHHFGGPKSHDTHCQVVSGLDPCPFQTKCVCLKTGDHWFLFGVPLNTSRPWDPRCARRREGEARPLRHEALGPPLRNDHGVQQRPVVHHVGPADGGQLRRPVAVAVLGFRELPAGKQAAWRWQLKAAHGNLGMLESRNDPNGRENSSFENYSLKLSCSLGTQKYTVHLLAP